MILKHFLGRIDQLSSFVVFLFFLSRVPFLLAFTSTEESVIQGCIVLAQFQSDLEVCTDEGRLLDQGNPVEKFNIAIGKMESFFIRIYRGNQTPFAPLMKRKNESLTCLTNFLIALKIWKHLCVYSLKTSQKGVNKIGDLLGRGIAKRIRMGMDSLNLFLQNAPQAKKYLELNFLEAWPTQ